MKQSKLKYSKGATFSGVLFWIGLAIIAVSTYALFLSESLGYKMALSVSIAIGIFCSLSIKGTIICLDRKTVEHYYELLFTKFIYKTISADDYDFLELRLYSDIESFQKIPQSTTVRTKVYELYLVHQNSRELILESTNYKKALQMLNDVSLALEIQPANAYEEWKKEILQNRRK